MKDVVGYEGLYAVTEDGKVWSYRSKKFLKPATGYGYLCVILSKNGIAKWLPIYQLVAQAYIPNPDNLGTVDHIDGNKKNNCVNNLQWMTQAENAAKGNLARRNSDELIIKCIEECLKNEILWD